MKFATAALSGLLLLGTITAHAQDPTKTQGTVQHIIVVVQENRTVDNLFGSNPTFESGVNVASSGKLEGGTNVTLTPVTLYGCYDLGHTHADFTDMYDSGNMDGADNESVHPSTGCTPGTNPPYRYADNSSSTSPANEVQPYFDIATQFGFAITCSRPIRGQASPRTNSFFRERRRRSTTTATAANTGSGLPRRTHK